MSNNVACMSDFTTLNKLGSGAFSEVYKVIRKSDRKEYALKKVRLAKLTAKEKDNAINEVRILASIHHENVAGYKEAFFEKGTSSLCIVMEYADGGDLQTKINTAKRTMRYMKEEEIWSIFYQMVNGLCALHKKKIVHRDIKCANVFLTKAGTVKLGDLNVSKVSKAGVMQTQTGTPYYASPEVWQDKPYDKSSDIWSLGAVLYEMVALSPPFTAKDMKGLYNKVIKGAYPAIPKTYSSDLSSMIASLLKVNPKQRPSAEQILHMPVFIAKYNEKMGGSFGEENPALLGTIKVPKNLSLLTERLPASQYEGDESQFQAPQLASGLPQIAEQHDDDINNYVPMVNAKRQQVSNEKGLQSRVASGAMRGGARNARQMSGLTRKNSGRRPSAQPQMHARNISSTQDEPIQMERGRGSEGKVGRSGDETDMIRIQPYQKKYLQGVPGSSPVIRATDDLNFQQKQGKGPLIERAERLKRLHELKANMNQRASERGESDEDMIRMIRDHRGKNGGMESASRRGPSSNLDIIYKNKEADVQILYQQDSETKHSNLPSIHGSQAQSRVGHHGVARQGGSRFVKPALQQIYGAGGRNNESGRLREVTNQLSRARSKDYIHSMNETPGINRNRYGAGAIIEAGRQESQRLLMERYRRVDADQPSIDVRRNKPKFVGSAAQHNYYGNGQGGGGSMPPNDYSRYQGQGGNPDSSRMYIPMSQKGTRPVQYSGQGGSRAMNPAMAMKIMYNQPSQAGGFNNASAGYHVHGGGVSRPSWWG